jgi:hypothetical protein
MACRYALISIGPRLFPGWSFAVKLLFQVSGTVKILGRSRQERRLPPPPAQIRTSSATGAAAKAGNKVAGRKLPPGLAQWRGPLLAYKHIDRVIVKKSRHFRYLSLFARGAYQ